MGLCKHVLSNSFDACERPLVPVRLNKSNARLT